MGTTTAVIGAGTMGAGIAYVFATAGFATTIVEPSELRQRQVRDQLRSVADDGVRRAKLTETEAQAALRRMTYVRDMSGVPFGCDLVVETVPEQLEVKRVVLQAAAAREPRILSTNTSALSVEELAAFTSRPESFLGTHFFNPVWSIGLVELVRGTRTSDETVRAASDIVTAIGKEVAVVNDAPGFATSRLDLVAALEAMRMVEQGVASAEDIDRAMRVAYRHPVGPLKLSDIVGLDVRLDIARNLVQHLGPGFAPPRILEEMVARGDLGEKSGRGFYQWT